jgi:hypothetical protein
MAVQSVSLTQSFAGPSITVYGNLVADVPFTKEQAKAALLSRPEDVTGFARIRAFRIGSGPCVTLPIPTLLVVFGTPQELTEHECAFAPGEVYKWNYGFGTSVLALEPSQGNAEDVLESLAARGIDGGLAFENPRYENGKICVDVHVWAKITVLGATGRFDERFPICVDVGGCVPVWGNGFASLEVCYQAPNRICGKLCVGKFGISKCWDQCVSIPVGYTSQTMPTSAVPCDCHGKDASLAPYAIERAQCISVTISNGKACLNIPIYGNVCIDIPSSVPSGQVAEACIDVCKKFGIPCGVKVYVKVAGQTVASQDWGCC